jgi:predicted dehydrogenase
LEEGDEKPSSPLTVIVIGAGNRGWGAYSSYGVKFPEELQVVGVAEPIPYRRERISKAFNIPKENQFVTWEDVFKRPKFADALFIATPDELHYGPAIAGLQAGYPMLLEKVIAQSWKECNDILELAEKKKAIVAVCHVLRYTPYFRKMKEIIDSGKIGAIVNVQHLEPVSYIHMSHSFVRGNWGNTKKSNPMILSKSCHDTDIIRWLINKPCKTVSSVGSLRYFKKENAPSGAPMRCTDGCPAEKDCPYSAKRIYLEKRFMLQHLNLETVDNNTIMRELKNGPYGRCVFHCDNDVVDHQVCSFEFDDQITASFSMSSFSHYEGRRTRIFGTKGDLFGDEHTLTVTQFLSEEQEKWEVPAESIESDHGGGDHGLVRDFIQAVKFNNPDRLTSTIRASMSSHLMGFKAEESRKKGTVEKVNM